MIGEKSVLAIIPARGGSKGVPRKNIRNVAGKPLIAWTIEEAKKSKYIDKLILSSDDAEIIAVAREWGCDAPFVRPAELSQDSTPGIEPVIHALRIFPEYDYVVLLQPTSPMRTVEDIDGCIELCVSKQVTACVSVTEPDKSPYWMYTVDSSDKLRKLIDVDSIYTHRQHLPEVYVLNGAVYVMKTMELNMYRSFLIDGTIAYVMAKESSIDIDSEYDVALAEILLSRIHAH